MKLHFNEGIGININSVSYEPADGCLYVTTYNAESKERLMQLHDEENFNVKKFDESGFMIYTYLPFQVIM